MGKICKFITLLICCLALSSQHLKPAEELLPAALAQQALEYTNHYRIQQGLKPVKWHQDIALVATTHSHNMGIHVVDFGHDGFKERIKKLSPRPRARAENVYMSNGRGDRARKCVTAWIDSLGHRKNLLGDYTHCGIGVYKNKEGYWYFTQIFGKY